MIKIEVIKFKVGQSRRIHLTQRVQTAKVAQTNIRRKKTKNSEVGPKRGTEAETRNIDLLKVSTGAEVEIIKRKVVKNIRKKKRNIENTKKTEKEARNLWKREIRGKCRLD